MTADGRALPIATARAAVKRGLVVGQALTFARDLINTPPRDLPPAGLAEQARKAAEPLGVKVEVLDEKALQRKGFGGHVGVGQGSPRPPRLVALRWTPPRATAHIALVGKGITFDSGGLSLKPSTAMETMKCDMSGAAAVAAAVVAAASLKSPVAVTGWLCCAENMPSGTAIRPSDVLTMYGGTRVEVLNTDAEGRLVLADGLARAAEDKPDAIIDIATLTGAAIVALGPKIAALMANDDAFRDRVAQAAASAGEEFWPMPLPADMRDRLDSSVADLANVPPSGGRDGRHAHRRSVPQALRPGRDAVGASRHRRSGVERRRSQRRHRQGRHRIRRPDVARADRVVRELIATPLSCCGSAEVALRSR